MFDKGLYKVSGSDEEFVLLIGAANLFGKIEEPIEGFVGSVEDSGFDLLKGHVVKFAAFILVEEFSFDG